MLINNRFKLAFIVFFLTGTLQIFCMEKSGNNGTKRSPREAKFVFNAKRPKYLRDIKRLDQLGISHKISAQQLLTNFIVKIKIANNKFNPGEAKEILANARKLIQEGIDPYGNYIDFDENYKSLENEAYHKKYPDAPIVVALEKLKILKENKTRLADYYYVQYNLTTLIEIFKEYKKN